MVLYLLMDFAINWDFDLVQLLLMASLTYLVTSMELLLLLVALKVIFDEKFFQL